MADPVPATIGRYKVLGLLGKGNMGVVYRAIDPMIDRDIAIKTIKLSLSEEELAQYEERFAQEAKTVGRLNHPHLVTIYDVGRTDQFAYMAMEFVDGRELKDYMAAGKPIDVAAAVDLVAQVADGLAFAHARDIVHRDVKPSNIMVAETPEGLVAKVMDFGIARVQQSSVKTMTGMILGSPRYMSPEQVIGKNIGPRSDVFSLGVVLYEMLSGIAPFEADSVSSIMYQTVHVKEPALSDINPAVPPPLDVIVAKALAKNLDERYATMREFYRALREAQKLLPEPAKILVVPPPAPPPTGAVTAGVPIVTEGEGANVISGAFDSSASMMRLAKITEQTSEVTMFLRRAPIVAPAAAATLPPLVPEAGTLPPVTPASAPSSPVAPPSEALPFPVAPAALLGTLAAVALVLGILLAL